MCLKCITTGFMVLIYNSVCIPATPRKADFLFIFSTTDGCVAYGHKTKGFISKFLDTLVQMSDNTHLEDILLDVKREVADEEYREDDEDYKQMPSVVSQMRDRVWFTRKT